MANEEQKPNEEVKPDVTPDVTPEPEAKKDERPELNYLKEIERHKADKERYRQELEAEKNKQVQRRDQNDISTWSDLELKALAKSNDPSVIAYKEQAEDLLLERKVKQIRERERISEKRAITEVTLRTQYPEALDPTSEFSRRMEEVIFELDLQKSPAYRLAAAKIVAAEFQQGTGKTDAAGRKKEEARLKDVKQTLSEGDRPDPRINLPDTKKDEEHLKIINNPKARMEDVGANMGELLKKKGFDFTKMFPR